MNILYNKQNITFDNPSGGIDIQYVKNRNVIKVSD